MTKLPSTKAMLNELNATLKLMNKKTLASWKGSREQLKARMDKADADLGKHREAEQAKYRKQYSKELTSLIERYNSYAVAIDGYHTIKEWNGSADELAKKVADAKRAHRDQIDNDRHKAKPVAKQGKKPPRAVKAHNVTKTSHLGSLVDELKLDAKATRTKLRKAFGSDWKIMTEAELRVFLTKK